MSQIDQTQNKITKLGVVYFATQKLDRLKVYDRQILEKIIELVAKNDPVRKNTDDEEVRLVIQSEIPWEQTETLPGKYDFAYAKKFAELCESLGINWTPLLSFHYVPKHILKQYNADRLSDRDGNILPASQTNFLPFSPSSKVWEEEASAWMKAAISEIAPYFQKTIQELLITNEMMYPRGSSMFNGEELGILTSFDEAMKKKWKESGNEEKLGVIPYCLTGYNSETGKYDEKSEAFLKLRSRSLALCLGQLYTKACDEVLRTGKVIPISWKLVPFAFCKKASGNEFYHGMTQTVIEELFKHNPPFIGIDGYPILDEDYYNIQEIWGDKPELYLAEFNTHGENWPPSAKRVCELILKARKNFATNITFFSWNGYGHNHEGPIQDEQVKGLADAFDILTPKEPEQCAKCVELQISGVESIKKGGYADYQVEASFDDGKKRTVTASAIWEIDKPGFFSTHIISHALKQVIRGRVKIPKDCGSKESVKLRCRWEHNGVVNEVEKNIMLTQ